LKTIIKVLIALAIINAAGRGAMAMWKYYQFRDAAEQIVVFGLNSTPDQLHAAVMTKAAELEVPVGAADVVVSREGPRTWADARYTEAVEFFPRYRYPIDFSFSVEGFNTAGALK
jgi:hypothetical protein